MDGILKIRMPDISPKHKAEHDGYEYYKRELVPQRDSGQCAVSVYEIPPKKAAYPYHYHTKNEESFYIMQGNGVLKTPSGDIAVSAGDFLFFPPDEKGAHKLTNISETEPLVYLDFDTHNEIDVAFYPDSGKLGIWGKGINRLYRLEDDVGYYSGE